MSTPGGIDIRRFKELFIRSLEALDLVKLHAKSDKDYSSDAQHHTLGPAGFQASPGDHVHDGRGSRKLYGENPPAVTGSRGGNVALTNLLNQLAAAGIITNNTSA